MSNETATSSNGASEVPEIELIIKASTIDGRRKGACLFCQEYFMDLYLLAELKTISLKVTTLDMQKPPPDFRTNFEATHPPILIDSGLAILENDKIERHIMKNIPGGYNLFVQDKDVATLIENVYSKLKLMLLKKEENKNNSLLGHLKKINDHRHHKHPEQSESIYNLEQSPLRNLVINPLSEENRAQHFPKEIKFKCYDQLDDNQLRIINALYRRCIQLDVPNISLLDGAAGTGKTCMIANLALQLVYGDDLPKPLKILICSKTNGNINDITRKLIRVRDDTTASTKIQLVRFGMLENIDSAVQRIKDVESSSLQFSSFEDLVNQKGTLELKIAAARLVDDKTNMVVLERQMFELNSLIDRFKGMDKSRLRDTATFLLNSCDIVCTSLASIPKLLNYMSKVDVCIIDEATQCSEPLTLLPFQLGTPSLVLVGDSQLVPLVAYSTIVKAMNFGKSMFARFQKLLLGQFGSPVFEMNFQYRIHRKILMWPNHQFYKGRLVLHASVREESFLIAPYKIISYGSDSRPVDSDNVMLLVKVLLGHVNWHEHSLGVLCTDSRQYSVVKDKLSIGDYPYIATNKAESYMAEGDVVIIWISEECGISHLAHQQTLNTAVTRARKSLLIFGANLTAYKNRPVWRSLSN